MSSTDQERALALDVKRSGAAKSVDATKGRIHRFLPVTFILAAIIVMACWLYLIAWLLSKFFIWLATIQIRDLVDFLTPLRE
jgi:hypothetical protein